jgi:hypothetical protein
MSDSVNKIADLSQWLGADAYTYLKIRGIFELADSTDTEVAKTIMAALDNFHTICYAAITKG